MDISAEIAAIQAASQGSELRQPLVGALNKLNSGSLPAVTSSDTGKILKVGANGWEVGEKSGYIPVPTATMQITENGTYDVINYASAVVNISSGGGGGGGVSGVLVGTADPSSNVGSNGDYYLKVDPVYEVQNIPYIRATGSQRISTGYTHKSNTKIVCDCLIESNTDRSYEAIFGARNSTSGRNSMIVFTRFSNANQLCIARSGNETTKSGFSYNKRQLLTFNQATLSWISHDEQNSGSVTANGYTVNDGTCPMYLFDINTSSNGGNAPDNSLCKGKIYSFKAYEGDTLVLDLIPIYDETNGYGMEDQVSGRKCFNIGGGTMDGGTDPYLYAHCILSQYYKLNGEWINVEF